MRVSHARIVGGLFAAVFGAASVLAFTACDNALDDCRNTRTCAPPKCDMEGGYPYDAGGCCEDEDGGFICDQ
jgi:hypothetical protein